MGKTPKELPNKTSQSPSKQANEPDTFMSSQMIDGNNNNNDNSNDNDAINWQQLLVDYEKLSVDEALVNIMAKIAVCENIQFDQMCLILKHYLLLDNTGAYLDHFLFHQDGLHLSQLLERFNRSGEQANVLWMISEIFKVVSSACTPTQANGLLKSARFQAVLLRDAFNPTIASKLAMRPSGLTLTETATLANIFDIISNLCDLKPELVRFINDSHIEWLARALLAISHTSVDLITAIGRLFYVMSSNAPDAKFVHKLIELFISQSVYANVTAYFATAIESQSLHLPRLYLTVSVATLLVADKELKKSRYLLQLATENSSLIDHSLRQVVHIEETKEQQQQPTSESVIDPDDHKAVLKRCDDALDCKLLAVELLQLLCTAMSDREEEEEESDDDEENLVECESDNEESASGVDAEMDDDDGKEPSSHAEPSEFGAWLAGIDCLDSLLLRVACGDYESLSREGERVEHTYSNVKLVQCEALRVYSQLLHRHTTTATESGTCQEQLKKHLHACLSFMASSSSVPIESIESDAAERSHSQSNKRLVLELCQIVEQLFARLNAVPLSLDEKQTLRELIAALLFKFKTSVPRLCAVLARILTLMAIDVRDHHSVVDVERRAFLEQSGEMLIQLTAASFAALESKAASESSSLRLNAELLDALIDCFAEDNVAEVEASLNLVARMRTFSDAFYAKFKSLDKKKKMRKEDSVIIKTVRDNLKAFVDYKSSRQLNNK